MTERKNIVVVYLFQPPNNLTLNYDKNWQPYPSDKCHFINFSESLFFEKWEPEKRFNDVKESHWKDWLGSIFWDEVTEKDGIVSLTYLQPEEESHLKEGDLVNIIHRAFLSFRIAFPFRPPAYTKSKVFIGEYEGNQNNYKINVINSVQTQNGYVDPFYARNSSKEQSTWYYNNFHQEDVLKEVSQFYQKSEEHLKKFKEYCEENKCVDRISYDPSQLWASIYTFSKALQDSEIGFSLLHFVRGIDCLLAMTKKEGHKDFPKKILSFLKNESFCNPFYEGFYLSDDLQQLYKMRSDCIHGRTWDYTFRKENNRSLFKEEIARFSFIAEDILRKLIKNFLYDDNLSCQTYSRELLETFWENRKE